MEAAEANVSVGIIGIDPTFTNVTLVSGSSCCTFGLSAALERRSVEIWDRCRSLKASQHLESMVTVPQATARKISRPT